VPAHSFIFEAFVIRTMESSLVVLVYNFLAKRSEAVQCDKERSKNGKHFPAFPNKPDMLASTHS